MENMKKKGIAVNLITILAIVGFIAVALFAVNKLGGKAALPGLTTVPDDKAKDAPAACASCQYDGVTVTLASKDKFDSGLTVDKSNFKYKVNDGASKTDSDGVFDLACGDKLTVLWGDTNSTLYYRDPIDYVIPCAPTYQIDYTGGVQNNSITTIQCFNQEGNLIDDTSENETLAAGDTVTLKCEMHGIAKKGMPRGGLMIAEVPKTQYDESEFALTGLGAKGNVPNAYTVSSTSNAVFAWEIPPMTGSGVTTFYAYIDVDDSTNPGDSNDITLKLYDANCFEEEDVQGGPFICAMEDKDASLVGLNQGVTETIQVD